MTLGLTSVEQDQEIIHLHCRKGWSYRDLGAKYGVSHEYIRRIMDHYEVTPLKRIPNRREIMEGRALTPAEAAHLLLVWDAFVEGREEKQTTRSNRCKKRDTSIRAKLAWWAES